MLQRVDRAHDREPHALAVKVALLKHRIGALRRFDLRFLAVVLNQNGSGAVDVEVGGHCAQC